jgi:hypothetical protein
MGVGFMMCFRSQVEFFFLSRPPLEPPSCCQDFYIWVHLQRVCRGVEHQSIRPGSPAGARIRGA